MTDMTDFRFPVRWAQLLHFANLSEYSASLPNLLPALETRKAQQLFDTYFFLSLKAWNQSLECNANKDLNPYKESNLTL